MKKPVTFGAAHEAGVAADLAQDFLKEKGWEVTFKWSHGKSKFMYLLQSRWEILKYRFTH